MSVPGTDGSSGRRRSGILAQGGASFTTMLREAANYRALAKTPYGLKPILVFTMLSAVLAVDGSIVAVALPTIVRELDLELATLILASGMIGFVMIFVVLAFGYLMDRVRRTPFVGVGAILSGVFSLVTTRTRTEWQFMGSRGADGLGGTLMNVPATVLIPDYYPPEVRGKTYALFGVVSRILSLAAPLVLAGLFFAGLSWRIPFFVTGPLLIVVGIVAILALKEPVRGYMERRGMGVGEAEARQPEPPASLGESLRTFWSIRTWRRLFIADVPGNVAGWLWGFFIAFVLFEQYGFNSVQIALVFAVVAAVGLPFGFMAGGVVDVLFRRRPQRILTFTGMLTIFTGLSIGIVATIPPTWGLVLAIVGFGSFGALLGPARAVLYAQITPAHVRGLGLQARVLADIPATILRVLLVPYIVANWGTTGGLAASVPFFIAAGIIELTATGFFESDMRAAMASQVASSDWRKAKQEGRGKLLVCRDVDVEYDGVQVLFNVDFDAEEGEIIALLGTNGAGKSTLLKAISGIQEASNGAIVFDGRDITHTPPHEIAARGAIHMPGGRGVFSDLTVRENLILAGWLQEEGEGKRLLDEALDMFPVLRERWGERAQLLSGGEQQMLSLAQAFLSKPRLLMIDELSLGLSPAVVGQLIEIVKKINQQGTTVIVVEQSVNVALTLAQRAIFMEKGEVRFVGRTAELLQRPDILRAVYVKGTGALVQGAPASALKPGRELRRYGIEQARTILEVRDVSKSFGGVTALHNVGFDLREGEALGLIGPNGAGKTTLFDIVAGYQRPDTGTVVYDSVDISALDADKRAKMGLIRRFQDARLFPSLTVYENTLVALDGQLEVRSPIITALQLPQVRQSERRARQRAERLIELLDLGAYRDKFVKELSTGLRRITDLVCVLAADPKLLLLDEPSTGIAQAEAESLAPLLRRVRSETGCSMLVIEHDMSLISAISDELLAMVQGKVVTRGMPEDVLNDERVIEAYLGTTEEAVKRSGAPT